VLLLAVTTAVSEDLVLVMLGREYVRAIPVVPVVALAFAFQGLYLLTSIGLNLSGQTQYYAVSTFVAAGVGLLTGWLTMSRAGAIGAAYAVLASFMTQAAVALIFARRQFPIPYESRRLVHVLAAGLIATAVAMAVVPEISPIAGLLSRAIVTFGVYAGLLWTTGFLRPTERAFVSESLAGLVRR
jgi:O-antigen/teichoic acid export membrane protein